MGGGDGEGGPQGTYNLTGRLGALEKNWEAAGGGGGGESSEGWRKVRWAWIHRHKVGRFSRGRNLPPQRGESRGQRRGAQVSVDDLQGDGKHGLSEGPGISKCGPRP